MLRGGMRYLISIMSWIARLAIWLSKYNFQDISSFAWRNNMFLRFITKWSMCLISCPSKFTYVRSEILFNTTPEIHFRLLRQFLTCFSLISFYFRNFAFVNFIPSCLFVRISSPPVWTWMISWRSDVFNAIHCHKPLKFGRCKLWYVITVEAVIQIKKTSP